MDAEEERSVSVLLDAVDKGEGRAARKAVREASAALRAYRAARKVPTEKAEQPPDEGLKPWPRS